MVHIKIPQLILAGAIAVAGLVGFGAVADAAAGTAAVACVNGQGAMDLTITNPAADSGGDASVSALIACDAPACPEGAITVVIDDSGVQHPACVASGTAVPPATAGKATFVRPVNAAPITSPAVLPKTGTGSGGMVIAALLVGCGSWASYVSRRKH